MAIWQYDAVVFRINGSVRLLAKSRRDVSSVMFRKDALCDTIARDRVCPEIENRCCENSFANKARDYLRRILPIVWA